MLLKAVIANHCEGTEGKASVLLAVLAFVIN